MTGVERLARAAVLTAARRAEIAVVEDFPDGRPPHHGRPGPTPPDSATVAVHDPAAYRAVFARGSVGLGTSYAAGWWDSDDLVGVVRSASRRLPSSSGRLGRIAGGLGRLGNLGPGRHSAARNGLDSRAEDRLDVQAHYDRGDEFFAAFLDPTLTYSCAYFERPGMSLEEASVAKLDRLCAQLDLGPDDEVLEIGTGWGSFAVHAAARYGCRVTTTTISDRQFAYARRRVGEAGLDHLVTVRNDDYRDLHGQWDKVVSIEMIEAVGWRQYRTFFEACAGSLRPNGLMALQAIVIDDARYERAKRVDDFIKAVVFPGSCIPSVGALVATTTGATDLRVVGLEDIGAHYAETLHRWRARFLGNRRAIAELGFDEPFLRTWDLYLAYCEAGFLERRISDVQMILAKPGWRPGPVGQ
jgi:cyclopropane-fatty-acyl-phospholipid synthase